MSNAKKKNVKRFIEIISHNVAEDAYHGENGSDIAPLVAFKTGAKLKVDFSEGSFYIAYPEGGTNATNILDQYIASSDFGGTFEILIQANEAKNQLVASLANSSTYQSVTNQVVIYEGDLTGEPSSTSEIDYAWPTVEFTINSDFGTDLIIVASILDGFSITN